MGIVTRDLADLVPSSDEDRQDDKPLGTALRGRFADLDVDSVDAVRELRER